MPTSDPIAERLDQRHDQWLSFAANADQYAEAVSSEPEGDVAGWRAPRFCEYENDIAFLLRALASLRSHLFQQGDPARLVLVLRA